MTKSSKSPKKPKYVWVIDGGDYSDYRIEGIYSTKHNADLAFKNEYENSEMSVGKWQLDVNVDKIKRHLKPFQVEISIEDSAISKIFHSHPRYVDDTTRTSTNSRTKKEFLEMHMWAKDEKHALKIASERRAQWIAGNGRKTR